MSYADYLNFKKTAYMLKDLDKLDSTIDSDIYTRFKSFNIQTTVINDNILLNRLKIVNKPQLIYDIEQSITDCPRFDLCNSNFRINRKPLSGIQSSCFPVMKAPGRSVPNFLKKPKERCSVLQLKCKCLDSYCFCENV